MKRFLSVDWDFFIDATADQRYSLFPDGGNENLPSSLRDYIWDTHYAYEELMSIKVSGEYESFLKICKEFKGVCSIADSHKYAYDFIMENTTPDEEFEVYNIDFHHDLYNYVTSNLEKVNCGNWGTVLRQERPHMKYLWVKREDSDTSDVSVDSMSFSQFSQLFPGRINKYFDFLYLCRSSVWSPPHLDDKFVRAVKILMRDPSTTAELGINKPRPYEIPNTFDNTEFNTIRKCISVMDLLKRS